MISYAGIFFEPDTINLIHSLESNPLEKVNDTTHCTFIYHPKSTKIYNKLVGKYFTLYLIGYASDTKNSGFKVTLPEELEPYYQNYDRENNLVTPHITASLSKNTKPFNTRNLNFHPLDKPIKIVGRFGYYIKKNNKEYLSFEPR